MVESIISRVKNKTMLLLLLVLEAKQGSFLLLLLFMVCPLRVFPKAVAGIYLFWGHFIPDTFSDRKPSRVRNCRSWSIWFSRFSPNLAGQLVESVYILSWYKGYHQHDKREWKSKDESVRGWGVEGLRCSRSQTMPTDLLHLRSFLKYFLYVNRLVESSGMRMDWDVSHACRNKSLSSAYKALFDLTHQRHELSRHKYVCYLIWDYQFGMQARAQKRRSSCFDPFD